MLYLDTTLDKLEKGLYSIQEQLSEIRESQRRLEIHNSFIIRLYTILKAPFYKVYQKIFVDETKIPKLISD